MADMLHRHLQDLLPDLSRLESILRPQWDDYFALLAELAARRSNCMKRRVGCIIARDNRVVATGYNGTPRGVTNCNQSGCARCNGDSKRTGVKLDECLCLHAEENALLEAGRDRVDRPGTVLYSSTCPCLSCAKKIIQLGVREVIYTHTYSMDAATAVLMQEAGVTLRRHQPRLGLGTFGGVLRL